MKIKIVFFGASKFVIPIIDVIRKNFDLVLVVTTEQKPTDAVPAFCTRQKIPYLSVQEFNNETMKQLNNVGAPLAVLAYFGLILPPEVLNIFPKGIINIHPSLLPKYRGPTPGQTAILNGDAKTGITIIKLDEEIDHGPILSQKEEPLHADDTAETLYQRLFKIGAAMLSSIVQTIELNKPPKETEQDHENVTFTEHLSRQSGYFDPNSPPKPEMLDRMIRAYYPWPGVWTRLSLRSDFNKGVTLTLKVIKLLPGKRIQVEGKKSMSYKDFLNGYPEMKSWVEKISA